MSSSFNDCLFGAVCMKYISNRLIFIDRVSYSLGCNFKPRPFCYQLHTEVCIFGHGQTGLHTITSCNSEISEPEMFEAVVDFLQEVEELR